MKNQDFAEKVLLVVFLILFAFLMVFSFATDNDTPPLQDQIDASPFEKHGFEEENF